MTNGRNKFTVEFDLGDAAMIVHAFAIARNTAMMCGYPDATKRFERYREVVRQFVPQCSSYFDEEAWSQMVADLQEVNSFMVIFEDQLRYWTRPRQPADEGKITIRIGKRSYEASEYKGRALTKPTRQLAGLIRDELVSLAGMDCSCEAVGLDYEETPC